MLRMDRESGLGAPFIMKDQKDGDQGRKFCAIWSALRVLPESRMPMTSLRNLPLKLEINLVTAGTEASKAKPGNSCALAEPVQSVATNEVAPVAGIATRTSGTAGAALEMAPSDCWRYLKLTDFQDAG